MNFSSIFKSLKNNPGLKSGLQGIASAPMGSGIMDMLGAGGMAMAGKNLGQWKNNRAEDKEYADYGNYTTDADGVMRRKAILSALSGSNGWGGNSTQF